MGENEIDVGLVADVLRAHRRVVVVGIALTLMLTFLSVVRVSPSGISYRSPEIWSNQATLVLTQEGAPELRSVLPTSGPNSSALADTSRFTGLIDVYAAMATSDPVVQVLRHRGLIKESDYQNGQSPITAKAVVSTVGTAPTVVGGGTTPMMTIAATGKSIGEATTLTRAATDAFVSVVESRQAAAKIPPKDRIQIRVVKSAEAPTLVKARSKAMPMLVLFAGLIATIAVAFTRENLARRQDIPPLAATRAGTADASIGAADELARQSTYARARAGARTGAPAAPSRGRAAAHPGNATLGRRTLGAVRGPDPARAREDDDPEDAEPQDPHVRSRASRRSSA